MKFYEDPKYFYSTIKLIGQVLAIWPLKTGASKTEIFFHESKWWLSFLNVGAILVPLILGVYYFRNDSLTMTKALSELTAVAEFFVNLIACKFQNNNFQLILDELGDFVHNANEYEELMFKKYINRYKRFQQFLALSFLSTGFAFACIPILTSQLLPTDGWYPFSVEPLLIRSIIYIFQVIAIGQVASGFIVDCIIATMLWFYALRTELLEKQVNEAKGKTDIRYCAYQHQRLILSVKRVKQGIKYIILKTNLTMTMAVISGAFQLIKHEPFEVTIRFILMVIAGSLKLYATAKAADDLKENNERLAVSAFQMALYQESPLDARIALMLAHHCQKPVIISVTGIIKAYCLEYYALFLTTAVKFFVNLRAILDN